MFKVIALFAILIWFGYAIYLIFIREDKSMELWLIAFIAMLIVVGICNILDCIFGYC